MIGCSAAPRSTTFLAERGILGTTLRRSHYRIRGKSIGKSAKEPMGKTAKEVGSLGAMEQCTKIGWTHADLGSAQVNPAGLRRRHNLTRLHPRTGTSRRRHILATAHIDQAALRPPPGQTRPQHLLTWPDLAPALIDQALHWPEQSLIRPSSGILPPTWISINIIDI